MKKIKIITSIKPDKRNRRGPSGLIWECIQILEAQSIEYTIDIFENKSFLNKLGIYFKKYSEMNKSEIILVYPFNLFFCLDNELKKKAIVLGPDSPSLLFERFYRNSIGFKSKCLNFVLKKWFIYKERLLLKSAYKFLVVGRNDTRWLRKLHGSKYCNIQYLTHPILQSVLEDKNNCLNSSYNKKSLVFAGDMSQKYTNKYIFEFTSILKQIDIDILIIGKNNKWIYDLFLSYSKKNISYVEWIENYAEVCNPRYHIHIIPLSSGAGTKNRTLTACAMGVTIISTDIGLENILYGKPVNKIFKFKTIKDVEVLLKSSAIFDEKIVNTDIYIKNVNDRFKKELLENLGLHDDIN